jgi:hypothetical protein
MKKGIAILLMLIMLIAGVHPSLAVHFCGGSLRSIELMEGRHDTSCCEAPKKTTESSCSDAHHARAIEQNNFDIHGNCCDLQKIDVSTDTFNHRDQQIQFTNLQQSFNNIWFTLHYTVNQVDPDNTITVRRFPPPEGVNKVNSNLLTFICIYRI